MSHYLDGREDSITVEMYRGKVIGLSFPMDGNKHNDPWHHTSFPVVISGKKVSITINTYEDGDLISIEIPLPESIIRLSAHS